jgi:Nuclease subunit of the excinuclease complex
VAKGPERDAGRETLFMPAARRSSSNRATPCCISSSGCATRRIVRDRIAPKLRKKDIREAGLQEIPGIGPSRKRALLHHFGTLKEIERASIADLGKVPGVSAESARKIFEFFHAQPG